jgi:hypothetical protein
MILIPVKSVGRQSQELTVGDGCGALSVRSWQVRDLREDIDYCN